MLHFHRYLLKRTAPFVDLSSNTCGKTRLACPRTSRNFYHELRGKNVQSDFRFRPFSSETGIQEPISSAPLTVFSEEQRMLQDAVRKFAEEEIRPLVGKMDEEGVLDPGILQGLFEQGLMGVEIGEQYGGSGMSFVDCLIVIEEISKVDPAVAVIIDIHNTLINRSIDLYGTDEQKQFYLPKLATDTVGSFCLSESESGSDAFSLRCSAKESEKDGNKGWILKGSKQWISNSKEAGLFLVFASVDFEKKHRGITAFLVDADSPGLKVGSKIDKLGIRASSTCEVILDDVFVPENRVLGEIGSGYKIAIGTLNEGRIAIAAQMTGLSQGAFNASIPYILERKQFGQRIGDFQGVKFQYAKMATEIEAARLLMYNAAALREKGLPFTKEAAMAKYFSSEVAERVSSKCIEFFGGYGFTKEYPLEKFFRDSKIGSIYEGTSNMQLETIAKLIQKEYTS